MFWKILALLGYTKGCQDIYNEVYKRVKSEGGTDIKAGAFARVAAANCMSKGKGD